MLFQAGQNRTPRRKTSTALGRASMMAVESLEDRTLFAWGTFPTLTGQAAAATNYPSITGAGSSIAILDTGVDYMHPALGAGFGPGHKVVAGWDFVDNDADPMDTDGHGTGLAGAAAANAYTYNGATYQGIAPGANIIALRTDGGFNWNKEAPYIAEALQWVLDHRVQYNIVAVSISNGKGHYTTETTENPNGPLFDELAALGVAIFNSSGNNGIQNGVPGIEYPGAEPSVYSVGAIDSTDTIWTSTERGPMMDLLAPGVNVPLPYWLSPLANPSAADSARHIYLQATGTSFTAPYAAAMVALLHQADPSLTGQEIVGILKQTGVMRSDGVGNGGPWARINVNAALTAALGDDVYEDNDTLGTATSLTFNGSGQTSLSNLKLIQGDADFYKFTIASTSDVAFSLGSNGQYVPGWTLFNSAGVSIQSLAASDDVRLSAGTYYVRVNAPATKLNGTYSFGIAFTVAPPAAPTNLSASAISTSTIHLSWTDASSNETGFRIEWSADGVAYSLLTTVGVNVTTYNDTGGSPDTQYYYRVQALGSASNSGYSNVASVTTPSSTPPPGAPGVGGTGNGIAYDSAGSLHFAWYDETSGSLKYAVRNASDVWGATQVIDANPLTGQFVSLALDAQGRPGVAYLDSVNADLKYAHFDGSAWTVRVADSNKITGYYPSLQFDASSRPVVTYYYKTAGDLRMAVGASAAGDAWTISTLDSAGDVGRYSSLALNLASGRWATAYENTTTGQFKYAEQTKTSWLVMTADASTKYGGGFISLAFSPKTRLPAMSYYDAFNADLKYATYNGSTWSPRAVASKGSVGLYSNLHIDASTGAADILYFSKTTDSVFSAKSNAAGTTWAFAQETTASGRWISRAFSTDGRETMAVLQGTDLELIDL